MKKFENNLVISKNISNFASDLKTNIFSNN